MDPKFNFCLDSFLQTHKEKCSAAYQTQDPQQKEFNLKFTEIQATSKSKFSKKWFENLNEFYIKNCSRNTNNFEDWKESNIYQYPRNETNSIISFEEKKQILTQEKQSKLKESEILLNLDYFYNTLVNPKGAQYPVKGSASKKQSVNKKFNNTNGKPNEYDKLNRKKSKNSQYDSDSHSYPSNALHHSTPSVNFLGYEPQSLKSTASSIIQHGASTVTLGRKSNSSAMRKQSDKSRSGSGFKHKFKPYKSHAVSRLIVPFQAPQYGYRLESPTRHF